MRFDTADADPDASSHADSGDNPHSHANAYPNASPNRYSHADSDANHHSHTNSYSNTHANAHSRANTHSHTNAHSRANTGTDVSTNASANTRTYDCHNSRPGDRCHTQPHRLNARPEVDIDCLPPPLAHGVAPTLPAHCPTPTSAVARDDICSGNQPGSPALHARGDACPGSWSDALAFPPALHARGNTCPGSWPDALAFPSAITSAPSLGQSTRDAIEPRCRPSAACTGISLPSHSPDEPKRNVTRYPRRRGMNSSMCDSAPDLASVSAKMSWISRSSSSYSICAPPIFTSTSVSPSIATPSEK